VSPPRLPAQPAPLDINDIDQMTGRKLDQALRERGLALTANKDSSVGGKRKRLMAYLQDPGGEHAFARVKRVHAELSSSAAAGPSAPPVTQLALPAPLVPKTSPLSRTWSHIPPLAVCTSSTKVPAPCTPSVQNRGLVGDLRKRVALRQVCGAEQSPTPMTMTVSSRSSSVGKKWWGGGTEDALHTEALLEVDVAHRGPALAIDEQHIAHKVLDVHQATQFPVRPRPHPSPYATSPPTHHQKAHARCFNFNQTLTNLHTESHLHLATVTIAPEEKASQPALHRATHQSRSSRG
jgi:hypothetical protein